MQNQSCPRPMYTCLQSLHIEKQTGARFIKIQSPLLHNLEVCLAGEILQPCMIKAAAAQGHPCILTNMAPVCGPCIMHERAGSRLTDFQPPSEIAPQDGGHTGITSHALYLTICAQYSTDDKKSDV